MCNNTCDHSSYSLNQYEKVIICQSCKYFFCFNKPNNTNNTNNKDEQPKNKSMLLRSKITR